MSAVPDFDFSYEEVLTAYTKVTSRNFATAIDEIPFAMSPLSDLFKHDMNMNAFW